MLEPIDYDIVEDIVRVCRQRGHQLPAPPLRRKLYHTSGGAFSCGQINERGSYSWFYAAAMLVMGGVEIRAEPPHPLWAELLSLRETGVPPRWWWEQLPLPGAALAELPSGNGAKTPPIARLVQVGGRFRAGSRAGDRRDRQRASPGHRRARGVSRLNSRVPARRNSSTAWPATRGARPAPACPPGCTPCRLPRPRRASTPSS